MAPSGPVGDAPGMRLTLIAVLALAGCQVDLGPSSSVSIASSPGTLDIRGCANGNLLSCTTTDQGWVDVMQVGIDHVRFDVPAYKPKPFEWFPDREFQLVVATPEDPVIWVRVNSRATEIGELPWFDIDWAPTVRRADGPIRLAFQVFPEATIGVSVTSRCAGRPEQTRHFEALGGEDGRVDVPFDTSLVGACVHDAQLSQTIRAVDDKLDAWVEVSRTETLAFTSSD